MVAGAVAPPRCAAVSGLRAAARPCRCCRRLRGSATEWRRLYAADVVPTNVHINLILFMIYRPRCALNLRSRSGFDGIYSVFEFKCAWCY